jgi:hypothetical protein
MNDRKELTIDEIYDIMKYDIMRSVNLEFIFEHFDEPFYLHINQDFEEKFLDFLYNYYKYLNDK